MEDEEQDLLLNRIEQDIINSCPRCSHVKDIVKKHVKDIVKKFKRDRRCYKLKDKLDKKEWHGNRNRGTVAEHGEVALPHLGGGASFRGMKRGRGKRTSALLAVRNVSAPDLTSLEDHSSVSSYDVHKPPLLKEAVPAAVELNMPISENSGTSNIFQSPSSARVQTTTRRGRGRGRGGSKARGNRSNLGSSSMIAAAAMHSSEELVSVNQVKPAQPVALPNNGNGDSMSHCEEINQVESMKPKEKVSLRLNKISGVDSNGISESQAKKDNLAGAAVKVVASTGDPVLGSVQERTSKLNLNRSLPLSCSSTDVSDTVAVSLTSNFDYLENIPGCVGEDELVPSIPISNVDNFPTAEFVESTPIDSCHGQDFHHDLNLSIINDAFLETMGPGIELETIDEIEAAMNTQPSTIPAFRMTEKSFERNSSDVRNLVCTNARDVPDLPSEESEIIKDDGCKKRALVGKFEPCKTSKRSKTSDPPNASKSRTHDGPSATVMLSACENERAKCLKPSSATINIASSADSNVDENSADVSSPPSSPVDPGSAEIDGQAPRFDIQHQEQLSGGSQLIEKLKNLEIESFVENKKMKAKQTLNEDSKLDGAGLGENDHLVFLHPDGKKTVINFVPQIQSDGKAKYQIPDEASDNVMENSNREAMSNGEKIIADVQPSPVGQAFRAVPVKLKNSCKESKQGVVTARQASHSTNDSFECPISKSAKAVAKVGMNKIKDFARDCNGDCNQNNGNVTKNSIPCISVEGGKVTDQINSPVTASVLEINEKTHKDISMDSTSSIRIPLYYIKYLQGVNLQPIVRLVDIAHTKPSKETAQSRGSISSPQHQGNNSLHCHSQPRKDKNLRLKERRRLTLVCTGLTADETRTVCSLLKNLCCSSAGGDSSKPRGEILKTWVPGVTHVIVKCGADKTTERTLEYLYGVASGCWVLSYQWALRSLQKGRLLPEKPFEALDSTGWAGPARGRLLWQERRLLQGCVLCFLEPLGNWSLQQFVDLVQLCGGQVTKDGAHLKTFPPPAAGAHHQLRLIVINTFGRKKDNILRAKSLSNSYGFSVVDSAWLVASVAMYSLVALSPYLLSPPDAPLLKASGISMQLQQDTQDFV
ncbi:breast cancer type 1 susceptibility protein homolog [Hyalella azteca]|uniref:Breast cancer type 1 susceptibility protein homolog n=1 Tax=Hyalella azteca TaxID=294128 RepID=A0A8B7PKM4_HYAAZ|nr:breast cancer type 1 susceptibility protein homolog [Hyalella azteca]